MSQLRSRADIRGRQSSLPNKKVNGNKTEPVLGKKVVITRREKMALECKLKHLAQKSHVEENYIKGLQATTKESMMLVREVYQHFSDSKESIRALKVELKEKRKSLHRAEERNKR